MLANPFHLRRPWTAGWLALALRRQRVTRSNRVGCATLRFCTILLQGVENYSIEPPDSRGGQNLKRRPLASHEASRAITRTRELEFLADRGVAVLEPKLDGLRHQHQQVRVKPALFIETRRPVARCLIKFEVANSHGPARTVSTTKRTLKPSDLAPEGRSEGADLQNRLYTVGMVPPSMTYSLPVIDAARGEARNATRSATSFGCAGRPSGMPPREAIRPLRAAS
jgi:hypothetical protein